ncbi:probable methyltransferase TCM_000336 [Cornus florida]|uniref:probable methyltransferase TCM_000336 n=1 Tax=Cornus florida TaxID=4283 RepID=UPI00289F3CCC|nr:probable methyltransferase TCM_000336 [Cornus florida]
MDVDKVFHMTVGVGETSYARNSSLQVPLSDMVKHITLQTIQEVYLTTALNDSSIANLGCSSGLNTLSIIREMVEAIEATSQKLLQPAPEYRVYLNDLPANDFNAIFKALADFIRELREGGDDGGPCIYVAGHPGTFYGRLFPNNSLHFIHSSYSLHWLSKVPPALYDNKGKSINKGNVYISESSPPQVGEAYFRQFQEDFSMFLRSRSKELISGGKMVPILLGRLDSNHVDRGNAFFWELLSQSFANLVSQGEIEREKLHSYDVHFFAPCKDELEDEVKREGSFEMDQLEMFEYEKDVGDSMSYGMAVAMTVRAIQESMICHHFGQGIVDSLFKIYGRLVDEEMAKEEIRPITFVNVLRKL